MSRVAVSVCVLLIAMTSTASAQSTSKIWRIGYLAQAAPQVGDDTLGEFRNSLKELGYVEGREYALAIRNADGKTERLRDLAAELVALNVDIIIAASTPPALAARRATQLIPIVLAVAADPVANGLAQSLARPGGNVTGSALAFDEISRKWLELLVTLRERLSRVAVLTNPTNESMPVMLTPLNASARTMKLTLTVHDLAPGNDPASVLAAVRRERPDGLVVLPDVFIRTHIERIVELTTRLRIPAVYGNRPWVQAGGLISYGADQRENFRRAAVYVDKILKGAKPADLPIERPKNFELVINLKAARATGLTIPPPLLLQADHVFD